MPYILPGTKKLIEYWNVLGRPCELKDMANAIKSPVINFMAGGHEKQSLQIMYGETEAQDLASVMGTTVNNINLSGDQILI